MERKKMERKFIEGNIPVWESNGISMVRIGKDEFITANPVVKGEIRNLKQAKEIAREFSKKNHCNATIAYETDWIKLIQFLKINYATKAFLKANDFEKNEVLLLDSMSEGESHVNAAGPLHCLDEIFRGFISAEDADGEPQLDKMIFLTIKTK